MKNRSSRDELLRKIGRAEAQAGAAAALVCVAVSADGVLTYRLDRDKLRHASRRICSSCSARTAS